MKLKNILTKNSHPNSHIIHVNFSLPNLSNLQLLYRPQNVIIAAALFQMGLCLNTIGFTDQSDRNKLHEKGLMDLAQLKCFTNEDIRGMATLGKRSTVAHSIRLIRLSFQQALSYEN